MFEYVDLRKTAAAYKNKEMECLNELSHRMDQFAEIAIKAHSGVLECIQSLKQYTPVKPYHWPIFSQESKTPAKHANLSPGQ